MKTMVDYIVSGSWRAQIASFGQDRAKGRSVKDVKM